MEIMTVSYFVWNYPRTTKRFGKVVKNCFHIMTTLIQVAHFKNRSVEGGKLLICEDSAVAKCYLNVTVVKFLGRAMLLSMKTPVTE